MSNAKLKIRYILAVVGAIAFTASSQAWAAATDLATEPMATSSSNTVRPNLLFTLDDSGSMGWDYLPDYAGGSYSHCKTSTQCNNGMPPFQAGTYNGVAYNPTVTYAPPVNADGTLKPSQTCANTGGTSCAAAPYTNGWTSVKVDGYGIQSTGTINLLTGYGDIAYCNGGVCKQNGIDTNNPFFEDATGSGNPPNYAFPGSLSVPSSTVVASTTNLFNGTLNGMTTTQQTVFNGTLNNGSPVTTSITLNGVSVSKSGTLVTLTYTSQSPATPVIVSGDLITVSGSSCSTKYKATNVAVSVVSSTKLTYTVSGGSRSGTTCAATVSHISTPSVPAPSISSDNTTVTVKLSGAHGLVSGDVVTIANGAGTCDAGYKATSVTATVVNSTTFTYPAAAALGTAGNTSCNITKAVTTPPSSPGISIAGNVVTVKLTGHGLANGDVIQVTGASCGTAFKTITTPGVSVTVADANTFTYTGTSGGTTGLVCKIDKVTAMASTLTAFTTASTKNGAPYEYVIVPVEFCDTPYLTSCVASSVPTTVSGVSYSYPAPVRYCKDAATAALAPGAAGAQTSGTGAINCQGKFSDVTGLLFKSVRYGLFYRVDVLPARTTYGNEVLNATINANGTNITFNNVTMLDRSTRSDCAAAPNCTYAEEMTNFANWYAYYHTRMQMMKTSAGKAFSTMDSAYRIGFVTINASTSWANKYVPVAQFTAAQKTSFYTKFYAINPNNSTPLREALARAGRYFAGLHGLPGDSMSDDPVEYSCQQNYVLLTTDGYWNGTTSSVVNLGGTQMGNQDNADSGLTKRSFGVYDGGCAAGSYSSGGCADTLADVAQYYYATDLRTPALANCTSGSATGATLCSTPTPSTDPDPYNNVPTPGTLYDPANWQHMVTFTLGLADGLMLYQPDYASSASGDFSKIKTGATGCDFSGAGTCNWPTPKHDTQTALDDLWHAAVNGRGTYYNARDPNSLAKGLGGALSAMKVQIGAAAASATSSPNITRTDRSIFSSTYRTVNWDGEVQAQLLDPATGNVPSTALTALPAFSSISLSGSTVTVNMSAHGLTSGDMIQVQSAPPGTCDSGYNTGGQSRTVTVVNANQFTYTGTLGGATTNTQCQFYIAGIVWSAQTQLDIKVNAAIATGTDPEIRARYIVTYDQAQTMPLTLTGNPAPNGVKEFRYSTLTAAEQGWFDNKCAFTTLSQCTAANLLPAQITSGNQGSNLVPYLRGNTTLEQTIPNPTYRIRQHFLGDTVNAKPAYVRAPQFNFTDPAWQANHAYRAGDMFMNAGVHYLVNTPYTSAGVFGVVDTTNAEAAQSYTSFLSANQAREAELYIAANDGMLHAFDAGQCTGIPVVCTTGTGNETWAYVPRMVMPDMYRLADVAYGGNHRFFVDGSPEIMDIYIGSVVSASSGLSTGWHTILVGGLGGGGRGFYALDITNPLVPIALWEMCSDSALCRISDTDLGYSYGNPVITKRSSDNRWVVLVTSGYNNTSPGTGQGYLYVLDAVSGAILSKIPNGSGSTATPSGLAKISAWADDGNTNNVARFVYGGDLNGDVWRFDLGAPGTVATAYPTLSSPATRFATLVDSTGVAQPITTRPELGDVSAVSGSIDSLNASGKPVIFIGTGRFLGVSDKSNVQREAIYALRDDFSASVYQTNLRARTDIVQQTISLASGTSSNNTVDWSVKNGWYADFPVAGELVNIDPVLTLGTLTVVTNLPGSSACETGGTSYQYQFNYKNGNNVPSATGGVVRSKIGNALTVGIVVVRLPSGQLRVIATSAAGAKINVGLDVSGTASTRNVSWRELVQ